MSAWSDRLLARIQPEQGRLQIAHDPDGLLLDEVTLGIVAERGFTILPWHDEVSYRLDYETRFRSMWDRGLVAESPAVLVHFSGESIEDLPWDIGHAACVHRLSLAELFPEFELSVVRGVPPAHLEKLFERREAKRPGRMGAGATADFVLLNVFKIADVLIESDADLLRLLLDLHFRQIVLPGVLAAHLAHLLRGRPQFKDWPLPLLLIDRLAFLIFIEERWPIAVAEWLALQDVPGIEEAVTLPYVLRVPGPTRLPFGDDSVRVILDHLFVEGIVPKLGTAKNVDRLPDWMRVGIATEDAADRVTQMQLLLDLLHEKLPDEGARHSEWIQLGWVWGEALRCWHRLAFEQQPPLQERLGSIRADIDRRFSHWLIGRYGQLASLPAVTAPVMGHHVAPLLARRVAGGAKVALIVMDGMAMDQWILLQSGIQQHLAGFDVERFGLFAWLPTLTSVARQAIFAGSMPRHLKNLGSTQGEPSAWNSFWMAQGVASQSVGYFRGIQRVDQFGPIEDLVSNSQTRAVGIVVDAIDEMMHGMTMGLRGLHSQVTTWAEYRVLERLFDLLLRYGFEIFVTADHGNIEARGRGRVSQGVLAEARGERVRIYGDPTLLESTASQLGERAIIGQRMGLPDGIYPLYASGRSAFLSEGEVVVAHGGACIEELIVPFVRVNRKKVST